MKVADRLSITEAIDRAGPVLFGSDWIDRLNAKETLALEKYGPKPRGQQQQSIAVCPRAERVALDRTIGRDMRLGIQRATVLDWIYAARVMMDRNYCDRFLLDRKLATAKLDENPVGAPPVVRQRVIRQMLDDVRSGRISLAKLKALKQDVMKLDYGASRKVCNQARKDAIAEAERQRLG